MKRMKLPSRKFLLCMLPFAAVVMLTLYVARTVLKPLTVHSTASTPPRPVRPMELGKLAGLGGPR